MRFSFKFPFMFTKNEAAEQKKFIVGGQFPAAMELWINGPVGAPVFTLTEESTGAQLGILNLSDVSIQKGESIYYSTRPENSGVWKISGGTQTSLVDLLNIQDNIFYMLPVGGKCIATLRATVLQQGQAAPIEHLLRVHFHYKG